MQEPKETRLTGGAQKQSPISSVKIERLQGSPYLRVTAVKAPPAEAARPATPATAPRPVPAPVASNPPPRAPAPTQSQMPRATTAPQAEPPAIPPIKTHFAQKPDDPSKRRSLSPIAKLGLTAVALTVLILVFLVPSAGPDDIRDVMPLAASVDANVAPAKPETVASVISPTTAFGPTARPIERPVSTAPANPEVRQNDFLAKLTADTVAALRRQEDAKTTQVYRFVETALAHGQSEREIDTILNQGHADNTLSVPKAMILPNGRVDTARILRNLARP